MGVIVQIDCAIRGLVGRGRMGTVSLAFEMVHLVVDSGESISV